MLLINPYSSTHTQCRFVEDVCSAFSGFVQNPQNNTLSSLSPCMDPLHADKTLIEVSSMIRNFITEVKNHRSKYCKILILYFLILYLFFFFQLNLKVADSMRSYSLTGRSNTASLIPKSGLVCDPFAGQQINSYTPQRCSNGAIPIGEFPKVGSPLNPFI